jgi:hypothetical protein
MFSLTSSFNIQIDKEISFGISFPHWIDKKSDPPTYYLDIDIDIAYVSITISFGLICKWNYEIYNG